jgi:hypothetical protein
MGYAFVIGSCVSCKRTFTFNPVRVPSIRVNGVREPVCRNCIEEANPKRVALGLEPFIIQPDAYDPVDENELS